MSSELQTISRRRFMQSTAAASAAAAVTGLWADPLGVAPGIQLYTVGDAINKDQRGTLEQLAGIGYKYVELYPKGMTSSAAEFRREIDAFGLKCPSAHLEFNAADLTQQFDEAHTIGIGYVLSSTLLPQNFQRPKPVQGMSVMENLTLDDFKRIADNANRVAKLSKEAGLQYGYHNHYFEFRDKGNGQIGYDILLKNTDPGLVMFEIDCGWMMVAGHDPIHYMKKYPGRFRMLHIKDFVKGTGVYTGGPDRPIGTELGRGNIDYLPIFAEAKKSGILYYYVEQEPPFIEGLTPIQAAAIDYQYLHKL
jgi:sugar phosphate isomerase/epimerase